MKHLFAFFMVGTVLYACEDFVLPNTSQGAELRLDTSDPNWLSDSIVKDCSFHDEGIPWEKREESFLLCIASHFEWYYLDDVIQKRLTENIERLSLESAAASTPFDEAIALGADQLDPIVKRRRIQRAILELRRLVEHLPATNTAESNVPTDALRIDFSHLYFTEEQKLHEQTQFLSNQTPEELDIQALGDPFFYGTKLTSFTLGEIERRFGREFSQALSAVQIGKWSHPIASELGWHLVWVHDRFWQEMETQLVSPLGNAANYNEKNAERVHTFLQSALAKSDGSEKRLR
jgi:hypothetical protein